MPSMHLTWALLIAINARSAVLRVGLWVYVVLIAAATLALREHYLVDLIAAVPYTIAVQWIAFRWKDYLSVSRNEPAHLMAESFDRGQPQS
jgi:membrane-associated phospholipid phosphatase